SLAANWAASAPSRLVTARIAPASASARLIAEPSQPHAPVTIATRPRRLNRSMTLRSEMLICGPHAHIEYMAQSHGTTESSQILSHADSFVVKTIAATTGGHFRPAPDAWRHPGSPP